MSLGKPPTDCVSEGAADVPTAGVADQHTEPEERGSLLKHGSVYYLQDPAKVHEILKVQRYRRRERDPDPRDPCFSAEVRGGSCARSLV